MSLDRLEAEALPGGLELLHARSFQEKRKGLAKRDALPAGVGLHIHRCRAIHTVGMRFDLDLLWLGADGNVVRVDRAVPPRRHRVCLRARSVVEVAAGRADAFVAALGTNAPGEELPQPPPNV